MIILGKEPDASSREKEAGKRASDNLRNLLSKIMMRRTQAEILKRLLPPRTDVIVYCGLTPSQQAEYEETSLSLKRSVDAISLCVPDLQEQYLGCTVWTQRASLHFACITAICKVIEGRSQQPTSFHIILARKLNSLNTSPLPNTPPLLITSPQHLSSPQHS